MPVSDAYLVPLCEVDALFLQSVSEYGQQLQARVGDQGLLALGVKALGRAGPLVLSRQAGPWAPRGPCLSSACRRLVVRVQGKVDPRPALLPQDAHRLEDVCPVVLLEHADGVQVLVADLLTDLQVIVAIIQKSLRIVH